VLADDLVGERQPQPGAVLLGREEGIEQLGQGVLGDAQAVVLDLDLEGGAGAARADGDRAAAAADLLDRLGGVADQVQQRLAQLPLVDQRRRQVGLDGQLERTPRALRSPRAKSAGLR
jgi:hypothetical protein